MDQLTGLRVMDGLSLDKHTLHGTYLELLFKGMEGISQGQYFGRFDGQCLHLFLSEGTDFPNCADVPSSHKMHQTMSTKCTHHNTSHDHST